MALRPCTCAHPVSPGRTAALAVAVPCDLLRHVLGAARSRSWLHRGCSTAVAVRPGRPQQAPECGGSGCIGFTRIVRLSHGAELPTRHRAAHTVPAERARADRARTRVATAMTASIGASTRIRTAADADIHDASHAEAPNAPRTQAITRSTSLSVMEEPLGRARPVREEPMVPSRNARRSAKMADRRIQQPPGFDRRRSAP